MNNILAKDFASYLPAKSLLSANALELLEFMELLGEGPGRPLHRPAELTGLFHNNFVDQVTLFCRLLRVGRPELLATARLADRFSGCFLLEMMVPPYRHHSALRAVADLATQQ